MLSLALLLALVDAGPSCDDALGASLCPDAFSLAETGACLIEKKVLLVEGKMLQWCFNIICKECR